MNKSTNLWMIATLILGGFIFGFATAKLVPTVSEKNLQARTITNDAAQNPSNEQAQVQLPAPLTADEYSKVPQSKDAEGNWTLGDKNAKVVVEEFSDFQCPFCHRYFAESFPEVFRNYISTGKIYYVYRNFPLSFHANASLAAQAALCAGDQNKYWEMHHALFNTQENWSSQPENDTTSFENLASTLQMDLSQFKQCLTSKKYEEQVKKDTTVGEKNAISGTPTFLINGNKLVGAQPFSAFEQAIDGLLNK